MPRLRRVSCAAPGFTRRKRGKGFEYIDQRGERIDDLDVLQRIKDLGIPPAWANVWICPDEWGHLQAVGTDQAGRRQYLYHLKWREREDRKKFERMIEFARCLPDLRRQVEAHFDRDDLSRDQVLAAVTHLLDRGSFRIGGENYAEANETYGLATILKRHVRLDHGYVIFEYSAKGGKRQSIHTRVARPVHDLVETLKSRRSGGNELFAYKEGGRWVDVRSSDINLYLKELTGGDYSAKYFRTWHGTVLAAVSLAVAGPASLTKTGQKRAISRAAQEVAMHLGNTPAVCRKSYIDPRVIDRFNSGVVLSIDVIEQMGDEDLFYDPERQELLESAVLDLIEKRTSDHVEKVADSPLLAEAI
jgi:DNA topoisomerase IB